MDDSFLEMENELKEQGKEQRDTVNWIDFVFFLMDECFVWRKEQTDLWRVHSNECLDLDRY